MSIKVGTIISSPYGKKMVELPEAAYFISNPNAIPEGVSTGVFRYEPASQFATYIPEDHLIDGGGVRLSKSEFAVVCSLARIALMDENSIKRVGNGLAQSCKADFMRAKSALQLPAEGVAA